MCVHVCIMELMGNYSDHVHVILGVIHCTQIMNIVICIL